MVTKKVPILLDYCAKEDYSTINIDFAPIGSFEAFMNDEPISADEGLKFKPHLPPSHPPKNQYLSLLQKVDFGFVR